MGGGRGQGTDSHFMTFEMLTNVTDTATVTAIDLVLVLFHLKDCFNDSFNIINLWPAILEY